uniref:Uncharacterized protein n=1 Tax=Psilocybe cubensis TaxID=181762 RepID=A0A8H8CEJ3_PSICU
MTPAGLVSKSRAHFVPAGARVEHAEDAIHIISSNGTIIHSAPSSKRSRRDSAEIFSRAYTDGYAAYSYWGPNPNTSAIANFSTSWVVPEVPARADGQLLYVFNALVPTSLDTILQPVLQFGVSSAGGGNYWAVASWYVNGPEVYYSSLYPVSVGQTVSGVMTLQGNKTSSTGKVQYSYNSVFSGISSTSMTINSNELLTYTYEALEIYTTSGATDLPTGKTTLKSINIVDQNGQHPTVNWTPVSNTAEGFGITVVTNGGNNGEIDLVYPSSGSVGGGATSVPASSTTVRTTTVAPSTTVSAPSSTSNTPTSSPTSVGAVSLYGQCGGIGWR